MLALAVRNTAKLVREKSKAENIRLGRLFTKKDTARLMASLVEIDTAKSAYTILVPGAGTGILAAAMVERICKESPACRQIFVTCYENDERFIPMLEDNLERIRKKCRHDYDVRLYSTVYSENYLTESKSHYTVTFFDSVADKFDIIIQNPPSELYPKNSPEALSVGGVTQVKIGAQYLFARLAATHLEAGGQLVSVLPTSVATASELRGFRIAMATELSLGKIHLFIGRQKNAKRAVPLGKNIILAYTKKEERELVEISVSKGAGSPENTEKLSPLAYDFVVNKEDGTLTLVKSEEDARIVKYISAFPETLTSLGLKVSTGLVIDSRCEGMLFSEPLESSLPIIRPAAIQNGRIVFPLPIKNQYIAPTDSRFIQKNKNMIIIKRVPAVSDERFVNSAIYLAGQMPKYRYISTHNKINYIDTKDKNSEICARLAFGLFALINSTIYDRFISIISKSKQINAKELKSLPLPPRNLIENIGMRFSALRDTSVATCDKIVNPTLHIIER